MAVTPVLYGRVQDSFVQGLINMKTHAIKGMLVGAGYTPNQNTHQFKNSVTNEVVGSGYVAGGQLITGINTAYSSKILTVTGGPLAWPSVTLAARYLVVYDDSYATQATKPLILYVDFGAVQSPTDQAFYYNWPTGNVMFKLAVP